ncbi:MAG: hypothetical protein HC895_09790 [Leptolyngbyaceae cyanobacterium SM1_3_5]|nr:hypothetical protein [Leptolyngbyaceae cyanobacterium SM1_3_5]
MLPICRDRGGWGLSLIGMAITLLENAGSAIDTRDRNQQRRCTVFNTLFAFLSLVNFLFSGRLSRA